MKKRVLLNLLPSLLHLIYYFIRIHGNGLLELSELIIQAIVVPIYIVIINKMPINFKTKNMVLYYIEILCVNVISILVMYLVLNEKNINIFGNDSVSIAFIFLVAQISIATLTIAWIVACVAKFIKEKN